MPNFQDPYCYPDTNVLVNKFGIRNHRDLSLIERNVVSTRLAELYVSPIEGNYDFDHLKKIHGYLFQDIYDWAGQERTVNISKGGTIFCPVQHILPYANGIFEKLENDNYLKGLDEKKFTNKAASLLADINELHPFREGNGRTQREFIRVLALNAGYDLDLNNVPNKLMIDASIQSYYGLNFGFENIINSFLKPLNHDMSGMQKGMDF